MSIYKNFEETFLGYSQNKQQLREYCYFFISFLAKTNICCTLLYLSFLLHKKKLKTFSFDLKLRYLKFDKTFNIVLLLSLEAFCVCLWWCKKCSLSPISYFDLPSPSTQTEISLFNSHFSIETVFVIFSCPNW